MASNLDFAVFAGASYNDTRSPPNRFPVPEGWTLHSAVPSDEQTGFEARAFQSTNAIVISYAGTYNKSTADLLADAKLGAGLGSTQLNQAIEYYLQIKSAPESEGKAISLTGHSLGGGLASLVGVFFSVPATAFDEAPFAQAALYQAQTLKSFLVAKVDGQGNRLYSDALLTPLTSYITQKEAFGASPTLIPNANLITNIVVQGEWLSLLPKHIAATKETIANTSPGASAVSDLHSISLLTAFLQSKATVEAGQRLNEVTANLPDLVRMVFERKLFGFSSDDEDNRSLIDHLVRHESGIRDPVTGATVMAADAMVTRFTADLWKLAQDGGLTLSESNLTKTLMAFAMQKYYDEDLNGPGYNQKLFIDLSAPGVGAGSGGIRFDMAHVTDSFAAALSSAQALNLSAAKG